jgi:hypothetical protein
MCEKIQRHGFGCTNIGVIAPQTPIGLIRFTRTLWGHSKNSSSEIRWLEAKQKNCSACDGELIIVVAEIADLGPRSPTAATKSTGF